LSSSSFVSCVAIFSSPSLAPELELELRLEIGLLREGEEERGREFVTGRPERGPNAALSRSLAVGKKRLSPPRIQHEYLRRGEVFP